MDVPMMTGVRARERRTPESEVLVAASTLTASGPIESVIIGGIRTARVTRAELAQIMASDISLARGGYLQKPRIVTSSNGTTIAKYHTSRHFRQLLNQADLVDADGMPVVFASRIFCRKRINERVATTDFVLDAAAAAVENGSRFYFLGGKRGVAEEAARTLRILFPELQIVGIRDGYFKPEEEKEICREVREAGTDVLWVGMGSPRQEAFATANRDQLAGVAWIRTCGGLFDHYTSKARRAPCWMREWGLEWVHRARMEPFRLGIRYLWTNPVALFFLLTRSHDHD
jgi:N-acetylglucosaminyldiphosphoundecaprenol N-acetyl-beta-D-mannosaminyltransferase